MKVADWIARFLKSKGCDMVFGLQGGAVVHLFDACERLQPDAPKPIYCHHEQAAAFAASAYARVRGFGVCIVTTGPGAVNAMTGVLGAWQDSIPLMVISGQARAAHTSYGKRVRQVGTQEFPIVDAVIPMTKYATFIRTALDVKVSFDTAFMYAKEIDRPGPVWIDLPVDIQWGEMP